MIYCPRSLPTQVVRFTYERTPFPTNSYVWAKVRGLPWWPGKFVAWAEVPEDTQEDLHEKYEDIGFNGGPICFCFDATPTYEYLEKEKIVTYERGVELNYCAAKGKGAGVVFRRACDKACEVYHTYPRGAQCRV